MQDVRRGSSASLRMVSKHAPIVWLQLHYHVIIECALLIECGLADDGAYTVPFVQGEVPEAFLLLHGEEGSADMDSFLTSRKKIKAPRPQNSAHTPSSTLSDETYTAVTAPAIASPISCRTLGWDSDLPSTPRWD